MFHKKNNRNWKIGLQLMMTIHWHELKFIGNQISRRNADSNNKRVVDVYKDRGK